jgi:hypothetical protein
MSTSNWTSVGRWETATGGSVERKRLALCERGANGEEEREKEVRGG